LLEKAGANVGDVITALNMAVDKLPTVSNFNGDVQMGQATGRLLNMADREAQQRGDQYLSTEVVLLAACDDNGELGKISKEQRSGEWPVWETSLVNPSFAAFARLCGGHGTKVTKVEDVREAIETALAVDGPALVEIMTDAELLALALLPANQRNVGIIEDKQLREELIKLALARVQAIQ